jgi:hypothetical protein
MNNLSKSNKSDKSDKSNSSYKFEDITDEQKIQIMNKLLAEQKIKQKKESKFKASDITAPGGKFDSKAFNKKVNKVQDIMRQKKILKDKIKLAKLVYRPLDHNRLTISQLKTALYADTYQMFREIANLKSFNLQNLDQIMSKNYRKLTVLIILLITVLSTYVLIYFLKTSSTNVSRNLQTANQNYPSNIDQSNQGYPSNLSIQSTNPTIHIYPQKF